MPDYKVVEVVSRRDLMKFMTSCTKTVLSMFPLFTATRSNL